jgi:hypothetical protein
VTFNLIGEVRFSFRRAFTATVTLPGRTMGSGETVKFCICRLAFVEPGTENNGINTTNEFPSSSKIMKLLAVDKLSNEHKVRIIARLKAKHQQASSGGSQSFFSRSGPPLTYTLLEFIKEFVTLN